MLISVLGWSGPSFAFPQRQRLLAELQRLRLSAQGVVADREVVHALQSVGVVGAQLRLVQRQRLLAELQCLRVPVQGVVAVREVGHARQRVGVVGAQPGGVPSAGDLKLLLRRRDVTQVQNELPRVIRTDASISGRPWNMVSTCGSAASRALRRVTS